MPTEEVATMLPFWAQLLLAALGGGATVKLLDIAHKAVGALLVKRDKAKSLVDKHLDPLLKSADEVVGKLRSLAEKDFDDFKGFNASKDWRFADNLAVSSLLYLIAAYWCRVELLRRESYFAELTRDKRGKTLVRFFDCLESRRLRILDRITQRAIGEVLIPPSGGAGAMTFVQVANLYERDESARRWLRMLLDVLGEAHRDKRLRHRVLLYGTILQAMTDTVDPKHTVAKYRPAYPNKLSPKERRDLRNRVFKVYVPEVRNKEKYYEV